MSVDFSMRFDQEFLGDQKEEGGKPEGEHQIESAVGKVGKAHHSEDGTEGQHRKDAEIQQENEGPCVVQFSKGAGQGQPDR